MDVLREALAVGLDLHLSHLIYIYKSKITKYMYMVRDITVTCIILYVTVKIRICKAIFRSILL
jgi:hypothetical protein